MKKLFLMIKIAVIGYFIAPILIVGICIGVWIAEPRDYVKADEILMGGMMLTRYIWCIWGGIGLLFWMKYFNMVKGIAKILFKKRDFGN